MADEGDSFYLQFWVTKFMTSMNWISAWLMSGMILSKASSMCHHTQEL